MLNVNVPIRPTVRPFFETVLLSRTALEANYANTISYPRIIYSKDVELDNDVIKTQEKPKDEYINPKTNIVIPEYAILQAIEEDRYDQPIFETLDHFYRCEDEDFLNRVREINKKEKVTSEERLEYYLSFWSET